MSEPKWTPGPWRWWTSNSWRRLSSDHRDYPQDGGVLCPCVSRDDGHPDCIVKDADMALIAAAPDLYDALFVLMNYTAMTKFEPDEGEKHPLQDASYDWAILAAQLALMKARGEV
jgi:hypothetical protein